MIKLTMDLFVFSGKAGTMSSLTAQNPSLHNLLAQQKTMPTLVCLLVCICSMWSVECLIWSGESIQTYFWYTLSLWQCTLATFKTFCGQPSQKKAWKCYVFAVIYTLQEQIGCFDHWVVNLVVAKLKRHLLTLVTSVQTNCIRQPLQKHNCPDA